MFLAAAAALVLGFSSCGGDDDDDSDAGPSKSALVDTLTKDNLFTEPQANCIADDVFDAASGLGQRLRDVPHALLRLFDHFGGDGHGPVVKTGGDGDKHQISLDDCARVADVALERGAGGNQAPHGL